MQKKIFSLIGFLVACVFATNAYAANYCISGDATTDCYVANPVNITNLSSGIVNNGEIPGDLGMGKAWWSAIRNDSGNYAHGIVNNGAITAWVDAIANYGGVISGGITNNLGATISGYHAIENGNSWTAPSPGHISSIYNAGSIIGFNNNGSAGAATEEFLGILNTGTIGTITNVGSIYAGRNTTISYGIRNIGSITTLNNLQGAGNANGALTYKGNLPTQYNVIINSSTVFGKLAVTAINTDVMTFDIHPTSTVDSNTYADVLSGVPAANLTVTSGTFGSQAWQLVETSPLAWDLSFLNSPPSVMSVFGSTSSRNNRAAFGAAQAIDTNQSLLNLFSSLNGDQEISDAASSTLPAISGGVSQMANIVTNAVTDVVSARQDLTRGLSSGDVFMAEGHLWFKPFGGWTKQDTRQGVTGYDVNSYGLALGFDGDVSTSWNAGAALAYINSDAESDLTSGSHDIDMDSYIAKVYATKMFDDVTALNLQAGAGISDYDSQRLIFTGDVATSDYDSWHLQLSAELERSYRVSDKAVLTPYAHADYSYVNVEDYNESGADLLSLNVDNDSADSLIIGAGVKANYAASDSLLLMANAGVGYDAMADRSSLTSSFAGGGAQFTTEGIEPDEWVYNAGVGAKYSLENGTEITASYNIDARQDYTDQSISANFRFMF